MLLNKHNRRKLTFGIVGNQAVLLLGLLCGATGLLRLWHPLKLSGSLVVRNGLADYSPVFSRYNRGFDHEIYTFWFFDVSPERC